MKVKLTKPQQALLAELPRPVSSSYEPAKKLVALGLARWEPGKWGSDTLIAVEPEAPDAG